MKKYVVIIMVDIKISQINASTSDRISQIRINKTSDKIILTFLDTDNIAKTEFIDEVWYTQQQILDEILTLEEWE